MFAERATAFDGPFANNAGAAAAATTAGDFTTEEAFGCFDTDFGGGAASFSSANNESIESHVMCDEGVDAEAAVALRLPRPLRVGVESELESAIAEPEPARGRLTALVEASIESVAESREFTPLVIVCGRRVCIDGGKPPPFFDFADSTDEIFFTFFELSCTDGEDTRAWT